MTKRVTLFILCGLVAWNLGCGGAEPAAPQEPAAMPETPVEPVAAEPALEEPAVDEAAAAPAETAEVAETPAAEPEAEAEAAPDTASDFQGKGADKITLGKPEYKKSPVEFGHWRHQKDGVKCGRCHHYGMKSCGGSDCHKRKMDVAPARKEAFHGRCMSCHKKQKVHKGCTDCHAEAS